MTQTPPSFVIPLPHHLILPTPSSSSRTINSIKSESLKIAIRHILYSRGFTEFVLDVDDSVLKRAHELYHTNRSMKRNAKIKEDESDSVERCTRVQLKRLSDLHSLFCDIDNLLLLNTANADVVSFLINIGPSSFNVKEQVLIRFPTQSALLDPDHRNEEEEAKPLSTATKTKLTRVISQGFMEFNSDMKCEYVVNNNTKIEVCFLRVGNDAGECFIDGSDDDGGDVDDSEEKNESDGDSQTTSVNSAQIKFAPSRYGTTSTSPSVSGEKMINTNKLPNCKRLLNPIKLGGVVEGFGRIDFVYSVPTMKDLEPSKKAANLREKDKTAIKMKLKKLTKWEKVNLIVCDFIPTPLGSSDDCIRYLCDDASNGNVDKDNGRRREWWSFNERL